MVPGQTGGGADRSGRLRRSLRFVRANPPGFSGGGRLGNRGSRRLAGDLPLADPDRTTAGRSGRVSSGHRACAFIVTRSRGGSFLASTGGQLLASAEARVGIVYPYSFFVAPPPYFFRIYNQSQPCHNCHALIWDFWKQHSPDTNTKVREIEERIAKLRNTPTTTHQPASQFQPKNATKKRQVSAAARKRMAAAQRKRWAAVKSQSRN